jgi:hypothetical protein
MSSTKILQSHKHLKCTIPGLSKVIKSSYLVSLQRNGGWRDSAESSSLLMGICVSSIKEIVMRKYRTRWCTYCTEGYQSGSPGQGRYSR